MQGRWDECLDIPVAMVIFFTFATIRIPGHTEEIHALYLLNNIRVI